jgi:hypothetical protein
VPLAAIDGVDRTGWTIQSDHIDLSTATITVTDGTNVMITTPVTQLGANYGSIYAVAFAPSGWSTQAGHSYNVVVSGVVPSITYTVEVLDCP